MRRITQYSQWVIDRTVRYFGSRCEEYKDNVIRTYDAQLLEEQMNQRKDESDIRYHYLFEYLGQPVMVMVFHLALAQYEYPAFGKMVRDITGFGINLNLAIALMEEKEELDAIEIYQGYRRLGKILMIAQNNLNYRYTSFEADQRLALYLEGTDLPDEALAGAASLYLGEQEYDYFKKQDQASLLAECIENQFGRTSPFLIQLAGKKGSGRKTLLKKAADQCDAGIVYIDYKRILERKKEIPHCFELAVREGYLYDGILCIYHICEENGEEGNIDGVLTEIERKLGNFPNPVVLCTGPDVSVAGYTQQRVYKLQMNAGKLEERSAVWDGYAAKHGLKLHAAYYGMKYFMMPERVARITESIAADRFNSMEVSGQEQYICNLCTEIISMPEKGSIIAATKEFGLADLKLPEVQMKLLKNVCAHFRQSYKVYQEWKLGKSFPYGKAATVLFAGPPGTGKTMAAGCIANEVSLPLYKINLSQVVDKYIGETEKKLEVVFKYSQDTNSILFFDEADALFSKRSEVKDAKDKYANTEVSYILQRIEQHDGIVILATNFLTNIDEAFMRRMKYVIQFQIPEYDTRLEIWKSVFQNTPIGNINFEYLAKKIELSGGYIKNIALNAAFYASQETDKITMKHILACAENEYQKLGRVNAKEFFSDYGFGV